MLTNKMNRKLAALNKELEELQKVDPNQLLQKKEKEELDPALKSYVFPTPGEI